MAPDVQAPPSRPAGHLQQLRAVGQAQAEAVHLALGVDEHAARGHVDAHGQGLGGEDELQQVPFKEPLHQGPLGRHVARMVRREALQQGGAGVWWQGQVLSNATDQRTWTATR